MKKVIALLLGGLLLLSTMPCVALAAELTEPALVAELPLKEKLHIYLCIGQSNMAGRGEIREEDMLRYDNVYLLNGEDQWEYAQPWYDSVYGDGTTVSGYNRYSTTRKTGTFQGTNPAMFFAKEMVESGELAEGVSIGIVSNARGNSGIDDWQKGYVDYAPEDGEHSGHADLDLFEEAVRRTKEAMKTGTLKGVLWLQGEGAITDDAYVYKLNELVRDLRNELGVGTEVPFIATEMPAFLNSGDSTVYNTRLLDFQSLENNTDFITLPDGLTHIGDEVHYDTASQEIVGTLFADKVMNPLSRKQKDDFEDGTDGWKPGYNKAESASNIATVSQSDGTLKATLVNGLYDTLSTATVTRGINGGSGIRLDEGRIRIKTRFKVSSTSSSARLYFKMNRPEVEKEFGTDACSKARYSLFRVSDVGFWYANGTTQYGSFATNSATAMSSLYSGSGLYGKWLNVEIVLDAPNEKADYYLTIENSDGTTESYSAENASLTRAYMTEYVNSVDTALSTKEDALVSLKRITLVSDSQTTTNVELDSFEVEPVVELRAVSAGFAEAGKPQLVADTVEVLEGISANTVTLTTDTSVVVPASVAQDGSRLVVTATEVTDARRFILTVDGATLHGETLSPISTAFTLETYVNDLFTEGTDGWKIGNNLDTNKVTTFGTADGTLKAVIPVSSDTVNNGSGLKQPSIIRMINNGEGIPFTEDRKIVVKTRIKLSDMGSDCRLYFKMNRPEDASLLTENDAGSNHYTLCMIRAADAKKFWYPGHLATGVPQLSYYTLDIPSISETSTDWAEGKWINIEMHLDGYHNKADYYVNIDGGEVGILQDVPFVSPYADANNNTLADDFSALKSITILTLLSGTTIEMDYFKVFETPALTDTFMNGEQAVYRVNTSLPVTEESLAGVTLTDASGETVSSIVKAVDTVNNDIIITVPTAMTDRRYTLHLSGLTSTDGDVLKDEEIYLWRPETEIRDDFADGVGKWEPLVTGNSSVDKTTMTVQNGIAQVSMPASTDGTTKAVDVPGIIRVINSGVGVTLEEGQDFVIKTRLKKQTSGTGDSRLYVRLNYPYDYQDTTYYANAWNHYTLASIRNNASYGFGYMHGRDYYDQQSYINWGLTTGAMDGKWIDLEIHIHGGINRMDLAYSYENESGETVKYRRYAYLDQPAGNHYKAYGDAYIYTKPVTTFDTIKTIAFTSLSGAQDIEVDYLHAYVTDPGATASIAIDEGSTIGTTGHYKSGSTQTETVKTIVALYSVQDNSTTLENIRTYMDKLLPYGYYDKSYLSDITIPEDGKTYLVKAFLWDSDTLQPLTEYAIQ